MADQRAVGSGSPSLAGVLRRWRADTRQVGAAERARTALSRPRRGNVAGGGGELRHPRPRRRRPPSSSATAPLVDSGSGAARGPALDPAPAPRRRSRPCHLALPCPEGPRGGHGSSWICGCGCPSSLPCMWRGLPARGGAALLLLAGAPGGRRRPLPSHRRLPLLPPSPSCVALSPASPAGEAGRPWRGKAERPRRTCFPPLLLLPCGGGAWRGGGGARRASRAWARGTEADAGQMAGSRPGCGDRPGQASGAGATRSSWGRRGRTGRERKRERGRAEHAWRPAATWIGRGGPRRRSTLVICVLDLK